MEYFYVYFFLHFFLWSSFFFSLGVVFYFSEWEVTGTFWNLCAISFLFLLRSSFFPIFYRYKFHHYPKAIFDFWENYELLSGKVFVRGPRDLKMPRTNSEKIDPKLYEIIFCPLFFGHYYWINQYTNSNIPTYSNYIDGYLWMRWCWLKSTRFDSVNHHMWYYVIIILM